MLSFCMSEHVFFPFLIHVRFLMGIIKHDILILKHPWKSKIRFQPLKQFLTQNRDEAFYLMHPVHNCTKLANLRFGQCLLWLGKLRHTTHSVIDLANFQHTQQGNHQAFIADLFRTSLSQVYPSEWLFFNTAMPLRWSDIDTSRAIKQQIELLLQQ